jgi:2-keto-4-pentenoate hydratase/2-oxohepta-3-ene-1,7-dioic acid hydratase in catechol pathway
MHLVTIEASNGPRAAVWLPAGESENLNQGDVVDINALHALLGTDAPDLSPLRSQLPRPGSHHPSNARNTATTNVTVEGIVAAGPKGVDLLRELLSAEPQQGRAVWRQEYAKVKLGIPLVPNAILCAGENYREHLDEKPEVSGEEPEFFLKSSLTLTAPGSRVVVDRSLVTKLDSEVELAVVIGESADNVPVDKALDHVFGYAIANDMTARNMQLVRHSCGEWMYDIVRGKSFNGALPFGPALVTADEVPNPQALSLRNYVDGELRQEASTAQMIWGVTELISYFSRYMTLTPGTLLITGTPGGTAWGYDAEIGGRLARPGIEAPYLRAKQSVRSIIDDLGVLEATLADC